VVAVVDELKETGILMYSVPTLTDNKNIWALGYPKRTSLDGP